MLKKIGKKLTVLTLATALFVSGVAMTASAADLELHASCGCGDIYWIEEGRDTISVTYVNPDSHEKVENVEYFCFNCGSYFNVIEDTYEGHSYKLDYTNGLLTCDCGDNYPYAH